MELENIPRITLKDLNSFRGRASKLYHIRTEKNEIKPYVFNQAQEVIDKIRNEEFDRSERIKGVQQCRLIILKGRQVGATTDTAMQNMDIMLNLNQARGLILAHDDLSTPIIYDKYKKAYDNLPDNVLITDEDGQPILDDNNNPVIYPIKPKHDTYSGYNLSFKNKTESNVYVRTAGSGDNVGKGDNINFCHFSEAANYEKYKEVTSSVNQQMAKDSFIYSVIESTANGVSGKGEGFYNAWTNAEREWSNFVNGRTNSFEGYRPVFIPWYKMQKYRTPLVNGKFIDIDGINFHSPDYKKEHLDMEEKIIEEIFDDREEGKEAVNWYRWCIKTNCDYDLFDAMRYYPHQPKDAFIASDKGFFDGSKLFQVKADFEKHGEKDHQKGFINEDFEFIPDKNGELKIWKQPDPKSFDRYVISLDPSYGLEGGDYSCMFVFDRLEEKFVAKWYGNMKEDLVAEEYLKLGYYYNTGLLIPEMNLKTVLNLIEPNGIMPYDGEIYQRPVKSRNTYEYGYNTLSTNKKDLMYKYNAWLRENYNEIPDVEALNEHSTFIKKITRGVPQFEASEGAHDDQVVAMALCIEGHDWWENEIYTTDDSKQNIEQIYEVTNKKRKPLKSSSIRGNRVR
jgi:hypothetical protein